MQRTKQIFLSLLIHSYYNNNANGTFSIIENEVSSTKRAMRIITIHMAQNTFTKLNDINKMSSF